MALINFEPNKKVHVLYHADCPDGKVAAAIVWKYYTDYYAELIDCYDNHISFYPAQYGDEFQDIDNLLGSTLYILDYSVGTYQLEMLAARTKETYFYDHHDTAIRAYASYSFPHKVFPVLDSSRSGAGITWDELFSETDRPLFVNHIEDADLWKFQYPETRNVLAGLGKIADIPFNRLAYYLDSDNDYIWYNTAMAKGNTINEYKSEQVRNLAASAYRIALYLGDGEYISILTINCNDRSTVSALGNALAYREDNESGIGLVWHWDGNEEKFKCSIRSRKDVVCNHIAEHFGGGGHPQAAGFSLSTDEYEVLL